MFSLCLFVRLFVCWQDYVQATRLIFVYNLMEKWHLGRGGTC